MAERRMLSKCISVSEKVNSLPDIFDMLLYTWIIPHADDFGRLAGSPAKVKALVVPMLDKTVKDVELALSHLHQNGLINWYEVDGTKYIQIENFEAHQTGLHKRTRSKFPDPPETFREIPGISENVPKIPLEQNRTEQNRREENRTETPAVAEQADDVPDNKQLIAELVGYYRQINGVTPTRGDYPFIGSLYNEFGYDRVYEAIQRLGEKMLFDPIEKPLPYMKGILLNQKGGGNRVHQANSRQHHSSEFDELSL